MVTKEINPDVLDAKNVDTKNKNNKPASSNGDYTADSIKVLGGMEAVRKRPAMYIGSTGEMGLHHLVYEVVDNSVDEALAGYADQDRSHHPYRQLHHRGRRRPRNSRGRHGYRRRESSRRAGGDDHAARRRQIRFVLLQSFRRTARRGRLLRERAQRRTGTRNLARRLYLGADLLQGRAHQQAEERPAPPRSRGTKVHFIPDKEIFTATEYNYDTLAQRLRELAFLNKGLVITLTDERTTDPRPARPSTREFKYNGGIAEFIKHLNRGKQVLHDKPIYMEAERSGVAMEIGLQYNDAYSENVFSFANNINTVDGGTHLSGFRMALTRTINYAGQQMGLFKDVKENLTGDDVREGLVAVISVKLPQPQFEGQTKGKLNSDIAGIVQAFINERLGAFFEQNSNGGAARSSTKPSTQPAPAKPRARPAILPAAKARWMAVACPAN